MPFVRARARTQPHPNPHSHKYIKCAPNLKGKYPLEMRILSRLIASFCPCVYIIQRAFHSVVLHIDREPLNEILTSSGIWQVSAYNISQSSCQCFIIDAKFGDPLSLNSSFKITPANCERNGLRKSYWLQWCCSMRRRIGRDFRHTFRCVALDQSKQRRMTSDSEAGIFHKLQKKTTSCDKYFAWRLSVSRCSLPNFYNRAPYARSDDLE